MHQGKRVLYIDDFFLRAYYNENAEDHRPIQSLKGMESRPLHWATAKVNGKFIDLYFAHALE